MSITLLVDDPRWRGRTRWVRSAAVALKPKGALNIMLADDAAVRVLNKQFRGKDKPTNVLSFPNDEPGALGDIILAYETIAAEAAQQGKQLKHHVMHLTVHGLLHLMGYDHETEADAEAMERIEIALLKSMGVANPYELG